MLMTTKLGPMRALIPAREREEQETLRRLQDSSALVVDDRRRRPLYFDGRFLAARDLTREQQYFLTRQADLGRAGGAGVVDGLMVRLAATDGTGEQALVIEPGHGVTSSGESVVLPEALTLRLTDVPAMQRLDATFGLLRRPAEPARSRTGLFVVALRGVEFSANPIAAYPTSITEKRTVEDGDIVEGVVATLIPYPDPGGDAELGRRRSRAARAIFVEGSASGLPVDALPLAMVALERNIVRWLDVAMVRREVGAEHRDVLGLGVAPRAVREAHLLQYDAHLADVLRERDAGNRGWRFAASEHFLALPPGGRLPAAAVNTQTFTQSFFPPEVTVDLSIVPEDEVPALVDESMLLPPIDLTLTGEALESTAVLVLVPVPVERVRALKATLAQPGAPLARALPSAAPGLIALRRPMEILRGIQLARLTAPAPVTDETTTDGAWAKVVSDAATVSAGLLWYVRRRNLDYRSDVVGIPVRVAVDDTEIETDVMNTMRTLGLDARVNALRGATSTLGSAELLTLLGARKFKESPLLANAVVRELERAAAASGEPQHLDRAIILKVAERFADPQMGEGLKRLEKARPELATDPAVVEALVESQKIAELDRIGRALSDAQLPAFTRSLQEAAAGGPGRIDDVIASVTPALPVPRFP